MNKHVIAFATALGIAAGSLGLAGAPAAAAISAPTITTDSSVQLVKHKNYHHWNHHKRWMCKTHWVKKWVWRHHHRVLIKVPKRHCGWVWSDRRHPWWW
jgi:hypothetical protein